MNISRGVSRRWQRCLLVTVALAVLMVASGPARADDDSEAPFEAVVVGTWQHASLPGLANEANGQMQVSARLPFGPGHWGLELKAGNSARVDGITNRYPDANDILQENPDHEGKRQLGVTQLFYQFDSRSGTLSLGLLSASEYLDTNPVANDEYRQFLAVPFVNNPTIAMPAYALAGVYHFKPSPTLGVTGYLSSTADLQESTYAQLFKFNSSGRGLFATAEVEWQAAVLSGNVGLWANTDAAFTMPLMGETDADALVPEETEPAVRTRTAYGVYANLNGHLLPALAWTLRLGWANPDVVVASNAISAAIAYTSEWRLAGGGGPVTFGAGLARTGVSSRVVGPHADQWQAEVYARVPLTRRFSLTTDLQWLRHGRFDPANGSVWVAGLRLGAEF